MDGIELGRQIARLRSAWRAQTRLAILRRSQPGAAAATAADCVEGAREPLRRFDALRRRPGPDPLPIWWAARPGGGRLAGGRQLARRRPSGEHESQHGARFSAAAWGPRSGRPSVTPHGDVAGRGRCAGPPRPVA